MYIRVSDHYVKPEHRQDYLKLLIAYAKNAKKHVAKRFDVMQTLANDNVLQAVFGHLWLVRRKLASAPAEVDEHLGQVEHACEHVMGIIRTTLDMARQPGDAPGPVMVTDVVTAVTDTMMFSLPCRAVPANTFANARFVAPSWDSVTAAFTTCSTAIR